MRLDLPPELEAIVEEAVKSGRYATPLEAARGAFLLLERETKFQELQREIHKGIDGPKSPWTADMAEDIKRRGRERLARERGEA